MCHREVSEGSELFTACAQLTLIHAPAGPVVITVFSSYAILVVSLYMAVFPEPPAAGGAPAPEARTKTAPPTKLFKPPSQDAPSRGARFSIDDDSAGSDSGDSDDATWRADDVENGHAQEPDTRDVTIAPRSSVLLSFDRSGERAKAKQGYERVETEADDSEEDGL